MIGNFRHRVTLKNPTVAKSSTGGTTRTHSILSAVWAERKEEREGWTNNGESQSMEERVRFTIRHSNTIEAGLSSETIIEHEGKVYRITGIEKVSKFYYEIKTVAIGRD
jgi:head-tail adaptor